jgi:Herpesvirus tegument protein, N-terminal conserved region
MRRCVGRGSLNQGDIKGGGGQCTFVSFTYLCRQSTNSLKLEPMLVSNQIDDLIRTATALHLSHISHMTHIDSTKKPKNTFLMINELPKTIQIEDVNYSFVPLQECTGLIGTMRSTNFYSIQLGDAFDHAFQQSPSCFFTMGDKDPSYTIGLYKVKVSN